MATIKWNEQAPLELLKTMPSKLDKKNIEELQRIIDVDKFVYSNVLHGDLCGIYAPFCDGCDKDLYCPCAQSYVKMMQSQGMDVEVAITEDEPEAPEVVEPVVVTEPETVVVIEPEPVVVEEPEPVVVEEKNYIRIAVARRKR